MYNIAMPSHPAEPRKTPITIRIDDTTLAWFRRMAEKVDLPYQTLINLYLRDCAERKLQLRTSWKA
jgi:uncharacterized protein (DUF4415 family)